MAAHIDISKYSDNNLFLHEMFKNLNLSENSKILEIDINNYSYDIHKLNELTNFQTTAMFSKKENGVKISDYNIIFINNIHDISISYFVNTLLANNKVIFFSNYQNNNPITQFINKLINISNIRHFFITKNNMVEFVVFVTARTLAENIVKNNFLMN